MLSLFHAFTAFGYITYPDVFYSMFFFSRYLYFSYSKEKRIKNWIANVLGLMSMSAKAFIILSSWKEKKWGKNVLLSHLSSVCLLKNICIKNITSKSFHATSQKQNIIKITRAVTVICLHDHLCVCVCVPVSSARTWTLIRINTKNFDTVHVKRMLFHSHSLILIGTQIQIISIISSFLAFWFNLVSVFFV